LADNIGVHLVLLVFFTLILVLVLVLLVIMRSPQERGYRGGLTAADVGCKYEHERERKEHATSHGNETTGAEL
jgi:hypothetical protein